MCKGTPEEEERQIMPLIVATTFCLQHPRAAHTLRITPDPHFKTTVFTSLILKQNEGQDQRIQSKPAKNCVFDQIRLKGIVQSKLESYIPQFISKLNF